MLRRRGFCCINGVVINHESSREKRVRGMEESNRSEHDGICQTEESHKSLEESNVVTDSLHDDPTSPPSFKNDITLALVAGVIASCPPPTRRSVAPKPLSAASDCFRFTVIYLRQQSILPTFINYSLNILGLMSSRTMGKRLRHGTVGAYNQLKVQKYEDVLYDKKRKENLHWAFLFSNIVSEWA
ncbi:unnamed protein product [Lactuca saligna]|uniref:Uncharacterized protein n=1 Tax=Lactuca saligna TaxID=75948 RepID=A0AA36EK77_LACSI|nr:unnamed protein product [Lactuca saligna]